MTQSLFAQKQKMTEAYLGDVRVAVTKLKLFSPEVVREKTEEKDGYKATVVSFGKTKKSGRKQFIREVASLGSEIVPGTVVHLTATSKGKGFAGVMKKWGFAGGPRTHGQSDRERAPGSIGQGTTPGRVLKGKHMAGRMGADTVTVRNLRVVAVDQSTSSVWVSGPVPGVTNSVVQISITGSKLTLPELKFLKGYNPITETQG